MFRILASHQRTGWHLAVFVGLVQAGCNTCPPHAADAAPAHNATTRATPSQPVPADPAEPVIVQVSCKEQAPVEGPLTLERLLALALENSPYLAGARGRAEAARGRLIQAGLYPNPTVGWQGDEIRLSGKSGGEQGPFVAQEVVTGGKLRLARGAAAQGVRALDWQAIGRWYEVTTRVRSAYYELLTAQREVREVEQIARQIEENVSTAEKLSTSGTVLPSDVLRFRVELKQTQNRLGTARQREEAARQMLGAAIGLPQLAPLPVQGMLEGQAPVYDPQTVQASVLTRHSEVQEAQAMIWQSQRQLALARAQVVPNVEVRLRPAYDFFDQTGMLFVEAGAPLPVFNRNQGNIVAAQADLARSVAEARQVEVRLSERLATAFQRYENARRQVRLNEDEILPEAARALEQVRRLYEAKGERFFDVLDAQRTLSQARLDYVQALGELWKAVGEIEGLLQQEPQPRPVPVAPCR